MNTHSAYMEREQYQSPPLSLLNTLVRIILGIGLSLAGSYVICTVLFKIKEFSQDPAAMKVFLSLAPEDPVLRTLVYQGQDIILPPATFHYFAYGIAVMLLAVAGLLGGSLLKRGICLLVP